MLIRRLITNCDGGVAPMLALAAIPVMASMGAALDYSRANAARTAMQAALDAAVLMVSQQPGNANAARAYFDAVFSGQVQNLEVSVTTGSGSDGTVVTGTASGAVKSLVMGGFGIPTIAVAARAKAMTVTDDFGCVLALDPSLPGAATAGGNTNVNLNNCSLYDNSSSQTALTVSGTARINALSVGVVGEVDGTAGITAMYGIRTRIGPVTDPYATVPMPSAGGCTEQKFSAKDAVTIDPGVYCGGFTVNAGAELTLNPGVYVINGGRFAVNGGATIKGRGVTLVFTSSTGNDWPTVSIGGGATVDLTAPQYGPTAGIVVFGDRRMPSGTTFKFNGGTSQYFGGAVYVPSAAIDFGGGSGTGASCTQLIGATITFSGNSGVAVNCSSYKTKPFGARVTRLSS